MNKQTNSKKSEIHVNPVVAAVTGAVIGAGVAAAGATAMKNEKNRTKAKKLFNTVKGQAVEFLDNMEKDAENQKDSIGKKLTNGKAI